MNCLRFALLSACLVMLGCHREQSCAACSGAHPGEHGEHAHPGAGTADHARMHHESIAASPAVADTSLALLTTTFTDQNDRPFSFDSLRGHPTLVAMFYGSCETVCPILLEDVRAIDAALAPALRAKTRIVLITFDPERDTSERLRTMLSERRFDAARTLVLRGDDDAIREVSMVLGVQYRRLQDGSFSHSALISLLDPEGRIVQRVEGLHQPTDDILAKLRSFP